MRLVRILAGFILLVTAASATELKIKVVDPQSVAVAGAQVELFHGGSATPVAIQTTSADGLAVFRELDSPPYRARILAAGFGGFDPEDGKATLAHAEQKVTGSTADIENRTPASKPQDRPAHPMIEVLLFLSPLVPFVIPCIEAHQLFRGWLWVDIPKTAVTALHDPKTSGFNKGNMILAGAYPTRNDLSRILNREKRFSGHLCFPQILS